jgi:methane monooxygenase component C
MMMDAGSAAPTMTDIHRVRLTFEGEGLIEIGCREDEDVVTAALRHDVLLLCDCREGACGACRAFLEDGRYTRLLEHSPHALSEREEEEGWVLACRLRPQSDLHLDFDYARDRLGHFEKTIRAARLVAVEPVAASVVRVVLRTLAAQEPLFWKPGQYVRLHLASAGVARAYSMANLPSETRELEFFVRLIEGGRWSAAIAATGGPGAAVSVEGPFGGFTLREDGRRPVFVAGGTGLAPVLANLRRLAADRPESPATLIFGVRSESDLFGGEELARLAAALPALDIHAVVAEPTNGWAGERGTVVELLARRLARSADPAAQHYYLCGPPAMVQAARDLLASVGVQPGDIHAEEFTATNR